MQENIEPKVHAKDEKEIFEKYSPFIRLTQSYTKEVLKTISVPG